MLKKIILLGLILLNCLFSYIVASYRLDSEETENCEIDYQISLYKIDSLYNRSLECKEPKQKIKYARDCYSLAILGKDVINQASSKLLESYAHVLLSDFETSLELLYDSKDLYGQAGYMEGVASCLSEIARVNKRMGNVDDAEYYYIEALNLLKVLTNSEALSGTYLNLGELYRKTNQFEKALFCFSRSDSIYRLINYNYGVAYAKGNIGLVFAAQNKLDSAKNYLENSISILEPLEDNYAVSSYLDGLAEVYFIEGKYIKAEQTALKSLQLAFDYGLKEQMRNASLRLADIYSIKGEYPKAYNFHKQYVSYRDSINNEETIRKIANLRTKYEVAQKQKEVDSQKSQKELYLILAVALICIVVLFIVLVVIMLKNSRNRERLNKILKEHRKELILTNATKIKFFSILSHDLRSPLATFNSYSEVIDLCIKHKEPEKLYGLSGKLKSSSANLLDLLDNLLQWGVTQMGVGKSKPVQVSVKDLVLLEVSHLHDVSLTKQIEVITQIPTDATLFVDKVSMAMAVRNLLNNALKFTASGGKITIELIKDEGQTMLKISDTGVGMTEEQKQKLFNFNQITSTYGTQNEKGVGLGMQLVCDFIKKSGAEINVDSKVGEGTAFTMTFSEEQNYAGC